MSWIIVALGVLSAAFAQDSQKVGHQNCIEFLNSHFGQNGTIQKHLISFGKDGKMRFHGTDSSMNNPSEDLHKIVFFSKPLKVPDSTHKHASGDVDYQLYYNKKEGGRFESFQMAQPVSKAIEGEQFKSAQVQFGWNSALNECTVEGMSRISHSFENGKRVVRTYVYPSLSQCTRMVQTTSGDLQASFMTDYLKGLKKGEESPITNLAGFTGTAVERKPLLESCQTVYKNFLPNTSAAGSTTDTGRN